MRYEDRLKVLRLWTLEGRHNRADLIEVYKIMHAVTDIPVSTLFQVNNDSSTRGHSMKAPLSTDARLHFFSSRVINRWNCLTQVIVESLSVNTFKRHLKGLRQKKMNFFMDPWREAVIVLYIVGVVHLWFMTIGLLIVCIILLAAGFWTQRITCELKVGTDELDDCIIWSSCTRWDTRWDTTYNYMLVIWRWRD